MAPNNNGFIKTSVESETSGTILKKLRMAKNITLEEVSTATKIQLKYLRWLEEDNYQKLPSKVYVEGFLKSCANYLKEDSEEMIKLFRKEHGIRENIKSKNADFKTIKPVNGKPVVVSFKTVLAAASFILAIGACCYIYRQAHFVFAPPKIEVLSPPQDVEVLDKTLEIIGKSSEGSQVSINGQQIYTDESGNFQEKIFLHTGLNAIKITSANRVGKTTETVRNVIYKEK